MLDQSVNILNRLPHINSLRQLTNNGKLPLWLSSEHDVANQRNIGRQNKLKLSLALRTMTKWTRYQCIVQH